MVAGTQAATARTADIVIGTVLSGIQAALDRTLSVGYGVVYDFIFERFAPYQELKKEILTLVAASAPAGVDRRHVRVLDIACGPGNLSLTLAEAGFTVVGIDPYGPLVDLAREKRRAKHLANLSFQHADLVRRGEVRSESFDLAVNVHSLYAHPAPDRVLAAAHRVLKPGGYAVFVNFTRRIPLGTTFGRVRRSRGLGSALQSLLWVLPNAIFEATRKRVGPHYWGPEKFSARLKAAGFTVLAMRPTFFEGASLLVWARKDDGGAGR